MFPLPKQNLYRLTATAGETDGQIGWDKSSLAGAGVGEEPQYLPHWLVMMESKEKCKQAVQKSDSEGQSQSHHHL